MKGPQIRPVCPIKTLLEGGGAATLILDGSEVIRNSHLEDFVLTEHTGEPAVDQDKPTTEPRDPRLSEISILESKVLRSDLLQVHTADIPPLALNSITSIESKATHERPSEPTDVEDKKKQPVELSIGIISVEVWVADETTSTLTNVSLFLAHGPISSR
jgi:hypothetical protein